MKKISQKLLIMEKLRVVAFVMLCLSQLNVYSQSITNLGNGLYQFESIYPEWDLHFWLFDDGHHSFAHEPVHQFENYSIPCDPILFHAIPYDTNDDNVDDIELATINNGGSSSNFNNPNFQNQIEIKRSWNLVNAEDNYFLLMFENTQYNEPISGCVEFHFNINHTNIPANGILDNYNNNWVGLRDLKESDYSGYTHYYTWPYHGLKPLEQRFVYIPAICLASSMNTVFTRGILKVDDCEKIVEEDHKTDGSNYDVIFSPMYTLRSVVSNDPHDPNFISSDPNCWTASQAMSQTIRYRLQFQNEGIHPSENVIVDFSSNIPIGSVELINSSNACQLTWSPNGIDVEFNSIYIRGLNEEPAPHYDHTIGWIEIDVCYNVADVENLNVDCIEFEAQVYFDNQHPIKAFNKICNDPHCLVDYGDDSYTGSCVPAPFEQGTYHGENNKTSTNLNNENKLEFQIYPNPANEILYFEESYYSKRINIIVTNLLGEEILNEYKSENGAKSIDISALISGVYIIKATLGDKVETKTFIKI